MQHFLFRTEHVYHCQHIIKVHASNYLGIIFQFFWDDSGFDGFK